MTMRVSPSSSLISFLRDWKSADKRGTSKSFETTVPPGRRSATVLLRLETSIPYCVHIHKNITPWLRLQLFSTSFNHCPFYLLWCATNVPGRRFNLHKTNAANEELVSRLIYGRKVQGGIWYTDCSYHFNSLSNKVGNSLLAVRNINHKYIVVAVNFFMPHQLHLESPKEGPRSWLSFWFFIVRMIWNSKYISFSKNSQ